MIRKQLDIVEPRATKREPSIELEKIVSESGDSATMPNNSELKQLQKFESVDEKCNNR